MSASSTWIFSKKVDLLTFGGSALASALLLVLGAGLGILHGDAPWWIWIGLVLWIDVSHVWSTLFRVYFDPEERARRPFLYGGAPVLAYLFGLALYSESALWFWRAIAYMALFHFVKQQLGWLKIYQRNESALAPASAKWDAFALLASMVFPIVYWHANLDTSPFAWMVKGDFVSVDGLVLAVAWPLYLFAMGSYLFRRGAALLRQRPWSVGKDVLFGSTAFCWFAGIVWIGSDYAFTVTNIIIHGVPYLVLLFFYCRHRAKTSDGLGMRLGALSVWGFLWTVLVFAFLEEALWDKLLWADKAWLYGHAWEISPWLQKTMAPLLAVPQITHYVLDGFIWRRKDNPTLEGFL